MLSPPTGRTGSSFIAVAAGTYHSMALRNNGTLHCCGDDSYGQSPSRANGPYVAIAAGHTHSLALGSDGTVKEWGGAIKYKPPGVKRRPPTIHSNGPFVAIAAGNAHSLALRENGTVVCWGMNDVGQAPPEGEVPQGQFVAIAAGPGHSLAMRADGTVVRWGAPYIEDPSEE